MRHLKSFKIFENQEDQFTLTKQSLKEVDYYMNQPEYLDSLEDLPLGHRWRKDYYPFKEIIKFVIDCFSKTTKLKKKRDFS